jgi:hypothetical protein
MHYHGVDMQGNLNFKAQRAWLSCRSRCSSESDLIFITARCAIAVGSRPLEACSDVSCVWDLAVALRPQSLPSRMQHISDAIFQGGHSEAYAFVRKTFGLFHIQDWASRNGPSNLGPSYMIVTLAQV